jgi:glutamyl-Q tRNA(Asp) synthetase
MQPDSNKPVFRFAPSPNGHLHLGHAYSALLNARFGARMGGRFLLRIEDIDTIRCTPALVADCCDDLAWLGLAWEEPVLRQSQQFSRYRAVSTDLREQGLLYPCFCSRTDINRAAGANPPRDPDGAPLYPGTCRGLSAEAIADRIAAGEPYALRLDMAEAINRAGKAPLIQHEAFGESLERLTEIRVGPAHWGDVVIVRKDIPASYHLAVTLDDSMQGVTHIVRGADLYEATAVHRLLQSLLGLPVPLYHHHALITDEAGKKLSKSAVSTPLRQLRAEGWTPTMIRNRLGFSDIPAV